MSLNSFQESLYHLLVTLEYIFLKYDPPNDPSFKISTGVLFGLNLIL